MVNDSFYLNIIVILLMIEIKYFYRLGYNYNNFVLSINSRNLLVAIDWVRRFG